jgi:Fic family protein
MSQTARQTRRVETSGSASRGVRRDAHRAMNWRKFSFEFNLDANGLAPDLILIEAYKEAATSLLLPPDWRAQLDRLNRVRAVYGTTVLEGNPLSEAEVSQQIDIVENPEEAAKRKATREQQQIRNAGRAQTWVRARFAPDRPPLSVNDILHMHKMITENSDEDHNVPGTFRTFPVVVGSPELGGVHNCAPHSNISQLMNEYAEYVNSREMKNAHPVIRALLSHFFLLTIHPFGDGNGRVSRLVEAGILFQGGYNVFGFYGLSNYFYRNETQYKTTLQACRAQRPFDVTPFVAFGLKGFAQELRGINNFIKAKLNRIVYRDTLVRAYNTKTSERRRTINQREYSLLEYLLLNTEPIDPFSDNPSRQIKFSELQASGYVTAAYKDVTSRTFSRELQRLADLHFIKFIRGDDKEEPVVELDFQAIGKY